MSVDLQDLIARRVLLTVPGMGEADVRKDITYKSAGDLALHLDVYRPPVAGQTRLPAVILVSGNARPEVIRNAKDWGSFVSGAQLVTAIGLAGVTFNKRAWHNLEELEQTAGDVEDAVDYVLMHADDLGIDPERLALWVFSAGPPHGLRRALRDTPAYLRCLVVYYGVMDLRQDAENSEEEEGLVPFSPITHLESNAGSMAPLLLVRAGQDNPRLNDSIDRFVAEALKHNAPFELINFPEGHHSFDTLDEVPQTGAILRRTLAFLREHLSPV